MTSPAPPLRLLPARRPAHREDLAPDFFPKLGWERQKLNQLEMRLELPAKETT